MNCRGRAEAFAQSLSTRLQSLGADNSGNNDHAGSKVLYHCDLQYEASSPNEEVTETELSQLLVNHSADDMNQVSASEGNSIIPQFIRPGPCCVPSNLQETDLVSHIKSTVVTLTPCHYKLESSATGNEVQADLGMSAVGVSRNTRCNGESLVKCRSPANARVSSEAIRELQDLFTSKLSTGDSNDCHMTNNMEIETEPLYYVNSTTNNRSNNTSELESPICCTFQNDANSGGSENIFNQAEENGGSSMDEELSEKADERIRESMNQWAAHVKACPTVVSAERETDNYCSVLQTSSSSQSRSTDRCVDFAHTNVDVLTVQPEFFPSNVIGDTSRQLQFSSESKKSPDVNCKLTMNYQDIKTEVYKVENETKGTALGMMERNKQQEENDALVSPRVRRCSSLKTGKTPPGTPGHKKIVRFADVLGLDLADVRTFLDEIPQIPSSAYDTLENADLSVGMSILPGLEPPSSIAKPEKYLVPLFRQPGGQMCFLDCVRQRKVCLENAAVNDAVTLSVAGTVRVLNLDFNKSVHIRYTLDGWKTFADLQATYVPNSCDGFSDKFTFVIYGHTLGIGQTLEFAVRFNCKGVQYWDNNLGVNYRFQCLSAAPPAACLSSDVPPDHWSFY